MRQFVEFAGCSIHLIGRASLRLLGPKKEREKKGGVWHYVSLRHISQKTNYSIGKQPKWIEEKSRQVDIVKYCYTKEVS